MRTTHTYAILRISQAAYDEIRERLQAAGYESQFHPDTDGDGERIDMHGIAVQAEQMIGTEESLEGFPCSAGFAPRVDATAPGTGEDG